MSLPAREAGGRTRAGLEVPETDLAHAGLPITIRALTKRYGETLALDAVDLAVASGEFMALLGPSGSGKTTLLMMIAGFTRPDAGGIAFGGREMVRLPPNKRNIGVVFQNYALFPHMNVAANVGYPLRVRRTPRAAAAEKVAKALELVRLGAYKERRVDQLSGGEQQRVALARAVVFSPGLLLMDEPLSALDKKLRDEMQIELRRLHDELGVTTISVTHDQTEALTMADRVAVINRGRIEQVDTPRRIYEHPANRFVAEFIGRSTVLAVRVRGSVAYLGDQALRFEGTLPRESTELSLVLRPEKLEFLPAGDSDGYNRLAVRVVNIVYKGDLVHIYGRLADGTTILVQRTSRQQVLETLPAVGAEIAVGIHARDTLLVP